jgi:hypothetical protein
MLRALTDGVDLNGDRGPSNIVAPEINPSYRSHCAASIAVQAGPYLMLRAIPENPASRLLSDGVIEGDECYIDFRLVLLFAVDISEKLEDWYWRGSS